MKDYQDQKHHDDVVIYEQNNYSLSGQNQSKNAKNQASSGQQGQLLAQQMNTQFTQVMQVGSQNWAMAASVLPVEVMMAALMPAVMALDIGVAQINSLNQGSFMQSATGSQAGYSSGQSSYSGGQRSMS